MSLLSKRWEIFATYWESGYLTDTSFICRNGSIKAHGVLLGAFSEFWKNLLTASTLENHCILLPEMDVIALESLLKLLYVGSVDSSIDLSIPFHQFFPDFTLEFNSGTFSVIKRKEINDEDTEKEDKSKKRKSTSSRQENENSNQCSICGKIFLYPKDVLKHRRIHSGETPYGCSICQKVFRNASNIYKHLRSFHHLENELLKNYIVFISSSLSSDKTQSSYSKSPVKSSFLKTNDSPSSFPSSSSTTTMTTTTTTTTTEKNPFYLSETVFSSQNNVSSSSSPSSLFISSSSPLSQNKSSEDKVNEKYKCKYCSKIFGGKVKLAQHKLKDHKGENGELCASCGKGFITEEQLARHEVIHRERERLYVCSFCPKTYFRRDLLKFHESLHEVSETQGNSYSSHSQSLLLHHHSLISPHSSSSSSCLQCQHCRQTGIKNLYGLKRHLIRHKCPLVLSEENCSLCQRDDKTFLLLQHHVKLNNQKKVHECKVCCKSFRSRQEVRTHGVVHTKEKPYSCELCDERFTQVSSLQSHYRRHSEKRILLSEFSCAPCDKNFKTSTALKAHQRMHASKNEERISSITSESFESSTIDTDEMSHSYRIQILDSHL